MKYLFFLISVFTCLFLQGQTIVGGNIKYSIIGWDTLNTSLIYDITCDLHVRNGSPDSFRFSSIQQQRFVIYKGANKNNLEVVDEYVVGGSSIRLTNYLSIPIMESNCTTPPDDIEDVELLKFRYISNLPVIEENYYLVYEGLTRDTNYTNFQSEHQKHFVISKPIYGATQQRNENQFSGELYNALVWFNNNTWKDTRHCIGDTSVIDLSVFLAEEDMDYRWEFYTPVSDWETDTPLTYKTGYNATQPLGDNYFNLSATGQLKVFVQEPSKYLIGVCAIGFDKNDGTQLAQSCQELTLQFYDCEPKVQAALAEAEQIAEDAYLLRSCETDVPFFGRNEGSISSGNFQWFFPEENIRDFNRNPIIQFPQAGSYQGQLQVEVEGCTDSVQVQVIIGDAPTSGLQERYEVCDLPITLEGNPDVDFIWEDGSTKPEREILASGNYTLTVIGNCERSQTIEVINLAENLASENLIRAEDTTICLQQPYTLSLQQPNLTNIRWNGETSLAITVTQSGYYSVEATTAEGCELYDGIQIEVLDCAAKLYIPSAFSPNNDGINDLFEIGRVQANIQSIQIFNRWGVLVYEGNTAWDGRIKGVDAAEGMYVYKIEYVESLLQIPSSKTGELILMR